MRLLYRVDVVTPKGVKFRDMPGADHNLNGKEGALAAVIDGVLRE